jgi:hypothetical protein
MRRGFYRTIINSEQTGQRTANETSTVLFISFIYALSSDFRLISVSEALEAVATLVCNYECEYGGIFIL